jgi:HEAT repeat protein
MFSMDDQEDEMDFLQAEAEDEKVEPEKKETAKSEKVVETLSEPAEDEKQQKNIQEPSLRRLEPEKAGLLEKGSEEDLRLRIQIEHKMPLPTAIEEFNAVIAAVQLRCSEELINGKDNFLKIIARAEKLFEKDFSFPFSCYQGSQLDRFWIFDKNESRDDELFEALVVAFEVVSRFKKALESDKILQEAKIRIAVGLSQGNLHKIKRGIAADPSWVGKPAYLAETLAEAAGDFSIYVDEQIHKAALPLFDFREWKPIKMRSPLPALPLFDLVGWNKPSEIAAFASHDDAFSRKAVAVAYRYLDLDNMIKPLLELLTDPDEKVALEALETLRVIGNEHALGLLKRIFPEAQAPEFRSAIIDVFASIGSSEVVPVILGSCKEASWKVRLSAAKALYKLSGKDALRHLEHLLKDSDGAVRACVNSIFFRESGKTEYLNNLSELLHDLSVRARRIAADELLSIDSDENLKIVIDGFADQEPDLQKFILRKLETSKSKILYQCFLTLFKISGERIRPAIVESVRRAGLVS